MRIEPQHLYTFSVRKTFDTGIKLYSSNPQIIGSDTTYLKNPREKHWGDLKQWELSHTIYKEWHHLQQKTFKTLGLWVFFFICCSTFSFLFNVGLKFTLEFLTDQIMNELLMIKLIIENYNFLLSIYYSFYLVVWKI